MVPQELPGMSPEHAQSQESAPSTTECGPFPHEIKAANHNNEVGKVSAGPRGPSAGTRVSVIGLGRKSPGQCPPSGLWSLLPTSPQSPGLSEEPSPLQRRLGKIKQKQETMKIQKQTPNPTPARGRFCWFHCGVFTHTSRSQSPGWQPTLSPTAPPTPSSRQLSV